MTDFVALIPAGGQANRLGPLPCSKEIFPIPGHFTGDRVKVTCDDLIDCFKSSGIENVHIIIRKGKWDIPQLLGDGSDQGVNVCYHIMKLPFGTPFSLDQAYPFVKEKNIALGFPDIILKPNNCFQELMSNLNNSGSDIVLGLFPIQNYNKWDMIEFENDSIKDIIIKGSRSDLKYGWSIAVWKPSFSEFFHHYLKRWIKENPDGLKILSNGQKRELYVGDTFLEGIKSGLKIGYVIFETGVSEDLGTHKEMTDYLRNSLTEERSSFRN